MSTRKIILLLLALCILLISPASGQITLDVDVPPGWALLDSAEEEEWGYWDYGSDEFTSFVTIAYDTNVPEELVGHENDPDALVAYAESDPFFRPDESGIDTVDGRLAGYVQDEKGYGYIRHIVFVKEDVFVEIDCDVSSEDHNAATELIESISLSTGGPEPTPTPSRGLVAHYSFDMDTEDHSGNGNDGTNEGATFVAGVSEEALRFDGVNDFVSAPVNVNPDVMPQMTLALWARADAVSGTIMSHDNGGYDRTIDIDYRGGGTGWSAFSGSGAVLGYYPVTIGEWTFIAAVYDQAAGTVELYVNDALYEETGSLGSGWDYLTIGKNPSFGAYFPGTIDEVRIYDYALSAPEIQALYQSVSIPPPLTPTPSPSPTPTPTPTPPPGGVGVLSPPTLTATLSPGESVTETKTYITAEGKPITKVDVLFEFDLTASMGEELSTMQTESQNIMDNLRELAPDSAFGVASFMDYPGSFSLEGYTSTYGSAEDYPWTLDRGVTTDTGAVRTAINGLTLGNGQDYPESYSRALYEAYADSRVGWRTGAKKIVIVFGDDIPHDPGYASGIDPGRDGEVGTADDLYFEDVVAGLKSQGITVLALHSGSDDRPWRYVAAETGGIYRELTHAEASELPGAIAGMVEAEVERIGELTVRAEPGYENWVSVSPTLHTNVGGGETTSFRVTVTVPAGTSGGTYEFVNELVGDGTVLGTQRVIITVPGLATPTPTTVLSPAHTLRPPSSPTLKPAPGEVGTGLLQPPKLVTTLGPGESVTEIKTYTTAEGKPITRVDVLFAFDLTSSMGEELGTMQTESQNIMNSLRELAPDSAFGVASFMDYPASFSVGEYSDTYGAVDDYPWRVDQGITTDTDMVRDSINRLVLGNGQDYPEAYSRALYESYADPSVGWRAGAKRIVIVFGDDIPHDPVYETGIDPGRDGEVGTADDLHFEDVVAGLKSNGITVLALHSGSDDRPWQYVVEETGGICRELTHAETSELPGAIAGMVEAEVESVEVLTLRTEAGYEDWVSFTPDQYTDVGGGETTSFKVTITVPEGTKGDTYTFTIRLIGDGTVLGTQRVTVTVPKTGTRTRISAQSHLENVTTSIKGNGDTIIRFSFRLSPREEARWLANRFNVSRSLETALEKRLMSDADALTISSRESTFIIPALVKPSDKTYTMPELDLQALEQDFQTATAWTTEGQFGPIRLVPTSATIEFPDAYTETFESTKVVPETSHTITGELTPWIAITRPPSGAVLQNATTILVRGSAEITSVSLLIQGPKWEERFEDNSRPFVFEWNISDPDVAGGSYRIEAVGYVGEEELEAVNDTTMVGVKKPAAPLGTVLVVLITALSVGAVTAAAGAASAGMGSLGVLRLKFSFHRSVLAAKLRTSLIGDLFRIAFGIVALSIAYTLQNTMSMKTASVSTPFSEEPLSLLVPTFDGGLAPNALSIFFVIVALVGAVIVVREVAQYLLAFLLDAEVGAIVDRSATVVMLGTGIFGHPFGYPLRAVIWEDLSPRVKGFICLGNIMSLFSLLAFFYYVSFVWYPEAWWVIWVGGVGIPAVAMTLVYSLIPFVGEEGTVIYEWNRLLAILLFAIAGVAYLSFTFSLFDPLTLQYSLGMFSLGVSGILIGGLLLYNFVKWINLL